jgi:hypothetical protein
MDKGTFYKIRGITSSGSSAPPWTPDTPLGGETPSFWIKENSRSGLTLVDSVNSPTNDISILPSFVTTLGVTAYAYINDNGALDIYDTDFTVCGWINIKENTSAYRQTFGKQISGSVQGRYCFYAISSTGYYHCLAQSSGTTVDIASNINASTCGAAFLLMDINQTSKKVRFFIWTAATGFNQIGVDTSFTGTFPHMADAYRFYYGCVNTVTTGAPTSYSQSEIADIRIFRRILTPTEQTALVNRGSVSNPLAYYPCNNINFLDSSGNGYHLTTSGIGYPQLSYGTFGSRQGLEVGYTRHTVFPNREIQIPYIHTSTPCASTISGYTKDADIPVDSLNHNGADSFLMPVSGTMDRSNVTTCTRLAVDVVDPFRYLVGFKGGLHSVECKNRNIASFFNDDYRGQNFIKRNGRIITDWVNYATNKTGSDYDKVIGWTGEDMTFAFGSGRYLSMGIYHPYSTSICLRLGASLLKEGPFYPVAEPTLAGKGSVTHIGNGSVLPLNIDKCNGTTKPLSGEINFLLVHESMGLNGNLHLYTSYNGIDYVHKLIMPTCGATTIWMESWFVDNDDPTDYHNIHYIGFSTGDKTIYESHPLNANFSVWSDFIPIFTTTLTPYNAIIWVMGGVYHMFYSAYDSGANTHYMHHATATYGAMTSINDWADIQTGDWSGLGNSESYSLINYSGTSWILYFWEMVSGSYQNYSISTDDCVTWSAKTRIDSLNNPLEVAAYINKLK